MRLEEVARQKPSHEQASSEGEQAVREEMGRELEASREAFVRAEQEAAAAAIAARHELDAASARLETVTQELENKLEEKESELRARETTLEALRAEADSSQRELERVLAKLGAAEQEVGIVKDELRAVQLQTAEEISAVQQLGEEREVSLQETRRHATHVVDEMRKQLKSMTGSVDGELEAVNQQLGGIATFVEDEHVLMRAQLRTMAGDLETANVRNRELEQSNFMLVQEVTETMEKMARGKAALDKAEAALAAAEKENEDLAMRLEEVARQAERAEERLKLFPASEQAASKVSAHVQDSFSDEEKVFADLQLKYNRAVVEARNRELEVVQMEEERGAARTETFKLRIQLQAMRDMMNQSDRDVMSQSFVKKENSKMGSYQEVGAVAQFDAAQHWLFAFPEVSSRFSCLMASVIRRFLSHLYPIFDGELFSCRFCARKFQSKS